MADEREPVVTPKDKLARRLVIIGGLVCFAAMWLRLVDEPYESWVPIRGDYGAVCWAWLLVPALALGSDRRRATLAVVVRVVLVIGGFVAAFGAIFISLATFPVLLLVLVPPPVLLIVVGLWPSRSSDRGASRLMCLIGLGGLTWAVLSVDGGGAGVAVLAAGSIVLLCGTVPWMVSARDRNEAEPLPRAIAR